MENLAEKLKQTQDQAFDKWFERWFQKQNFDKAFEQAASEGYTGYHFNIANDNRTNLCKEEEYLIRRLRDERTIEKLKEKLPGIEIRYVKKKWKGNFLGITTHRWKDYISFSW